MMNENFRYARYVNEREEYNEFRLENSEHEDADIDDLPLSFLIKLSENNLYTGNLKLSTKENNIKNDQDLFPINSESSRHTGSKSIQKCNEPACLTSKCVHGSENQSVESKCASALSIGFPSKSVCDISFANEGIQHDVSKSPISQCKQINFPLSNPKLVSQEIQYNKADCQIPESVHGVQTSPSSQISEAIQCDIDDRIASNVVSSSNSPSSFNSVERINRCICCKRDLEACEFLTLVDNESERIPENDSKENERYLNERVDRPKGDEQFSSEGNEIGNASLNPVTSSPVKVSSPLLSATNACRNVVKKKVVKPLLIDAEMAGGVSSQDFQGDACIISSNKDGDDCDTCLEKEADEAENLYQNQQLPDDIGRTENSSAFDPVERADYVAKWINNLVPENASPPLSLVEETGNVESNEEVSKARAHQKCGNCPFTTSKKRTSSADNCGGDTSSGTYLHSLSSSCTSSPELLITKNKHINRKTLTSHNRRNMLFDQSCKRLNKGEKNSVSFHLDVEERNAISSAIPVERIDYVASWIKNLNPESASPLPCSVEKTEESNRTVFKVGTLSKHTNHQISKDSVNESSQQSLLIPSASSPEIQRTKKKQSNGSVISPFYRDGYSSVSSVPESLNDELIHEFANEDFEDAMVFEKLLASQYFLASQKHLASGKFEINQRKKFLCSKTKSNKESSQKPLEDNDISVKASNCNNSHREIKQKLVVRETQSDSSTTDVPSPPKRKYFCLSGVEPNGNSKPSKNNLRKPYTMQERKRIIKYIVENNKFSLTKGQMLWQDMERAKVCERTWQSMKEHFRKQILPRIEYFHLEPDITQKFFLLRK